MLGVAGAKSGALMVAAGAGVCGKHSLHCASFAAGLMVSEDISVLCQIHRVCPTA